MSMMRRAINFIRSYRNTATVMHVHANLGIMRTTVEIKPEHRSALIALAARRGQKGFSSVLEEAIESYLGGERERVERRQELLSLAGSLSESEVEDLRHYTHELRASWR